MDSGFVLVSSKNGAPDSDLGFFVVVSITKSRRRLALHNASIPAIAPVGKKMRLLCLLTARYSSSNNLTSENAPVLIIIRLLFDETIFLANVITAALEADSTIISAFLKAVEDTSCENFEKIGG
jgi:hypothetical protein